jgi:hypothetical protein
MIRFRRSLRIAPGVHLNAGMHGLGVSVGPRGISHRLGRACSVPAGFLRDSLHREPGDW